MLSKHMSGQMQAQSQIQTLAAWLARPARAEDTQRAQRHLLDWAGCAIAGRRSTAGDVFATLDQHSAADHAFFWGALGNVLEMDDVDKRAILHPGPSIVPAALALAKETTASWDALLSGIVRGYEATIRLGRVTGAGHYALWHTTGTCGAIGAAAACASILGLGPEKTGHALSLALSQSAGLWQTRHAPVNHGKQLHTANAARAGVTAVKLAGAGAAGPAEILEGPQGVFAAMCPDARAEDLLTDYNADWLIHQVSFKPWPACRHAHAAIDAALSVRERLDGTIEAITVRTYSDAIVFCDQPSPTNTLEAKFSLQHSVAAALLRGPPQLKDFAADAIRDADLGALRARVEVKVGDDEQKRYPAHYGACLSIKTDKSALFAAAPDALGDPENPLSDADLVDKARALMFEGGMSRADAETLIEMALTEDMSISDFSERFEGAVR